jgi:hypothetical protein
MRSTWRPSTSTAMWGGALEGGGREGAPAAAAAEGTSRWRRTPASPAGAQKQQQQRRRAAGSGSAAAAGPPASLPLQLTVTPGLAPPRTDPAPRSARAAPGGPQEPLPRHALEDGRAALPLPAGGARPGAGRGRAGWGWRRGGQGSVQQARRRAPAAPTPAPRAPLPGRRRAPPHARGRPSRAALGAGGGGGGALPAGGGPGGGARRVRARRAVRGVAVRGGLWGRRGSKAVERRAERRLAAAADPGEGRESLAPRPLKLPPAPRPQQLPGRPRRALLRLRPLRAPPRRGGPRHARPDALPRGWVGAWGRGAGRVQACSLGRPLSPPPPALPLRTPPHPPPQAPPPTWTSTWRCSCTILAPPCWRVRPGGCGSAKPGTPACQQASSAARPLTNLPRRRARPVLRPLAHPRLLPQPRACPSPPELENWVLTVGVSSIKLNTHVDSGAGPGRGGRGGDGEEGGAGKQPAAWACWGWPEGAAPALRPGSSRPEGAPPTYCFLRPLAEFTGSLAQFQEGLQKLNLNEEVGGRGAGPERRGAAGANNAAQAGGSGAERRPGGARAASGGCSVQRSTPRAALPPPPAPAGGAGEEAVGAAAEGQGRRRAHQRVAPGCLRALQVGAGGGRPTLGPGGLELGWAAARRPAST